MRAVRTVFQVLEELATRQPAGVSELARVLELPKSTVQRALLTLREIGWIRPVASDLTKWALTPRILAVGSSVGRELGLHDVADAFLRDLNETTGETVHLVVPDDPYVVLIEHRDSQHAVRTYLPVGQRAPMHASASGKSILAARPDDEIINYLARHGLPTSSSATIVDEKRLWKEIETTRRRGFATNSGEWRADINSVGAAILGLEGTPVAAISVSAPSFRLPPERQSGFGPLVRAAAEQASQQIRRESGSTA